MGVEQGGLADGGAGGHGGHFEFQPGAAGQPHLRGQTETAIGFHRFHAPAVHGVANAK